MRKKRPEPPRAEIALYRRNARQITDREILAPAEKAALIEAVPKKQRQTRASELQAGWAAEEEEAVREVIPLLEPLKEACTALDKALEPLASLKVPELLGKVEDEQTRVRTAHSEIATAVHALSKHDFGTAGGSTEVAARHLWAIGGHLVMGLNDVLSQAAIGRPQREKLQANLAERQAAKRRLQSVRARAQGGLQAALEATVDVCLLEAKGFTLVAEILGSQVQSGAGRPHIRLGRDNDIRIWSPQECETFSDVGGLEHVKEQLRQTIGAILERPDKAAIYRVVHNGILFHGPPGTGKTLLSRALAGEYGLRYIRFSPASIASAYIHEAAANLQRLFELARENTPCVLFLDEIDTIASPRDDQPSADHREVVTQLMNCLEEYRNVQGLVIIGATNNINRLDHGLREGRFDAKIQIPLPDPQARKDVVKVQLNRRSEAVNWDDIDFDEIATLTNGRNAAALEAFVSIAAQNALRDNTSIGQAHLIEAIKQREGKDQMSLDEPVTWGDVVLADHTREHLMEIVNAVANPELARAIGVKVPAGILLHGPPGTGKTTIARALATEIQASFYEQSAADMLSKWAGESEERVAKLFTKARANRPSIIFIDEIDSLLRRRSSDSSTPWDERVVSQFLRELDGLVASEGVFLVGATNRIDIIDPAITGRRLTPLEVGLPDGMARIQLLRVLCKNVAIGEDVDFKRLGTESEGMSGADMKRLRDLAGMKALNRAARTGVEPKAVRVTMADFRAALDSQKENSTLIEV